MSGFDLKVQRMRARLRLYEVAGAFGKCATWLWNIENGVRPLTPEQAEAIAETIDRLAGTPAS